MNALRITRSATLDSLSVARSTALDTLSATWPTALDTLSATLATLNSLSATLATLNSLSATLATLNSLSATLVLRLGLPECHRVFHLVRLVYHPCLPVRPEYREESDGIRNYHFRSRGW